MMRIVGVLLGLPLAGFVLESLLGAGGFHARWDAWRNTLVVAGGAALVGVALGMPVGVVLSHSRRRLFLALTLLPLLVPPALGAAAWLLLPLPAPGPVACALILGGVTWPVVALLLQGSLARLPQSALDAASLQLSTGQTLRRVVWPHSRATIATGAALVFLLAASDFTVPATFTVPTVSTVLYERLSVFEYASAAWTALPLLVLGGAMAAALRRIPIFAQPGAPREFLKGPALVPAWMATIAAWLVSVALPICLFASNLGSPRAFFKIVTVNLPSIAWSAWIAALAAILLVAWASLAPGRSRLEPVWLAALVVPGIVTALGALTLSDRLHVQTLLAPSGALFVVALMARFASAAWLPLREPVERAQLEAAELAGLSRARIWWKIVWPALCPRALAMAAIVFILCLGEIGPAVLLNPPGPQAVVQHLFNGLHYREIETVSSLSLFLFAAAILVTLGAMNVRRLHRAPVGR
jgi:ABC-type Fe3+ transport system permease subunit